MAAKSGPGWGEFRGGTPQTRALARWLRNLIDERSLTLAVLAARVHRSRQAISRNLNGLKRPDWSFIEQLVLVCAGPDGRTRRHLVDEARELWDAAGSIDPTAVPGTGSAPAMSGTTLRDGPEARVQAQRTNDQLPGPADLQVVPQSRIWNVPFPPDPNFIGRDDYISSLSDQISQEGTRVVIVQTVAGLGGIGKTQLAVHYAHREAEKFSIVWWIDAADRESIVSSLSELGSCLGLPRQSSASEVLTHLATIHLRTPWLLIYDNVETPYSLRALMPTRGNGWVLLTSRYQRWPPWAEELVLPPLTDRTGVELLVRETGDSNIDAAMRITQLVDGLPLALAQVAAHVRSGISLAEYAEILETGMVDALEASPDLAAYDQSIVEVVRLAVNAATRLEPTASRMLQIFAFLAPDRIVERVLSSWPDDDPFRDPIMRVKALRALEQLSLIRRLDQGSPAYTIHRVVQTIVAKLFASEQAHAVRSVLRLLRTAVQQGNRAEPNWIHGIASHARSLLPTSSVTAPRETEQLLLILTKLSPSWGIAEDVGNWAAKELLTLVERRTDATDDELVTALVAAHRPERRAIQGRTQADELWRALHIRMRTHGEESAEVAELRLLIANHISRRQHWFIELDVDEDDLRRADELATAAIQHTDAVRPRTLALAHYLRAGIRAHRGLADQAAEEYEEAFRIQDGPKPSPRRTYAAQVLLKFGRYADARRTVAPLIHERAGTASLPFIQSGTADDVYQRCLTEQYDWAAYLAHMEQRMGTYDSERPENHGIWYGDLAKIWRALSNLENNRADAVAQQMRLTLSELLRRDLEDCSTEPPPNPLDDPAAFVDLLEQAAVQDPGVLLRARLDELIRTPHFVNDRKLTIRVMVAARRAREIDSHKVRESQSDSRNAKALLFYSLAQEAHLKSTVNWTEAEKALKRALLLSDAVSEDQVVSAMLGMCTVDTPQTQKLFTMVLDKLAAMSPQSGSHSLYGYCEVPAMLSRAATTARRLRTDHHLAAQLALQAASFEEERHGRNFGSVATYLLESGQHACKSTDFRRTPLPAIRGLQESLEIVATCCGSSSPRWAFHAATLASVLSDIGQIGEARTLLDRASNSFNSAYGPTHSHTRTCIDLLRKMT